MDELEEEKKQHKQTKQDYLDAETAVNTLECKLATLMDAVFNFKGRVDKKYEQACKDALQTTSGSSVDRLHGWIEALKWVQNELEGKKFAGS